MHWLSWWQISPIIVKREHRYFKRIYSLNTIHYFQCFLHLPEIVVDHWTGQQLSPKFDHIWNAPVLRNLEKLIKSWNPGCSVFPFLHLFHQEAQTTVFNFLPVNRFGNSSPSLPLYATWPAHSRATIISRQLATLISTPGIVFTTENPL